MKTDEQRRARELRALGWSIKEIERHLGALEEKTGKPFGDTKDPLLVSVRSGAAVSMPGMMDSILNLGLNDEAVARATENERFANDSYRRLIRMYGEVVDGIHGHRFERALTDLKKSRGASQDVDLSAHDLAGLIDTYQVIYREETGREPALSTTGGTSDGRFIARLCPQVIEFGPVNASIHKIDEHVAVADLEPLKNIYRRTMERLLL